MVHGVVWCVERRGGGQVGCLDMDYIAWWEYNLLFG